MASNRARTCLIISTILFGLGGLAGVMLAIGSFFLFDAPGSEKNPATILLFWSSLTFPVVCAASIGASWITYAIKKFRAACWIAFLPLINIAGGSAALIWLEIFNGGRLS